MKMTKKERQASLINKIEQTPFITDEEVAKYYEFSVQTSRLGRVAGGIPELRERIKTVAARQWNETVKSLSDDDVIGDIIDLELVKRASSIMTIQEEQVFSRN